jgi:hypothetical protein
MSILFAENPDIESQFALAMVDRLMFGYGN